MTTIIHSPRTMSLVTENLLILVTDRHVEEVVEGVVEEVVADTVATHLRHLLLLLLPHAIAVEELLAITATLATIVEEGDTEVALLVLKVSIQMLELNQHAQVVLVERTPTQLEDR